MTFPFDMSQSLAIAQPELVLALGGMVLLVTGVFFGGARQSAISRATLALFIVVAALIVTGPVGPSVAFGGSFLVDGFTTFAKLLVLAGSATAIVLSDRYMERARIARFEFPILVAFATLGMMMMISANDLIALYVAIELQSLCLYVLASFSRDSLRSTEAGLKYFVLGALASCLLLYGMSLVYGFSGTVSFEALKGVSANGAENIGFLVGLVFILAGFAFKISAVPFHMWTPDVYEGAPTPVTAFFATAPKVAAIALLTRVLFDAFGAASADWRQIITFISIASMALGAFAAIGQTNIKRLMSYSSISNMGFALVGLAAGSEGGVEGLLIYLVIYFAMTAGIFACILAMRRREGQVEDIADLAGLASSQPLFAFVLTILLFSYAGIPPLAGFFGKFYVFSAAVEQGMIGLAVIGVLTSVVGAYYYVRIVMLMINGEPKQSFVRPMDVELRVLIFGSTIFTLFFVLMPGPLVDAASAAASALVN